MRFHQKGQALPLGLALLMFGVVTGIVLYNTGQAASDKARLANTADAAAYSGLLWQARALNYQAYTNRAMVANQVSMGQAVSLSSWIRSGRIAGENLDNTIGLIPFFRPLTQPFNRVVSTLDKFLDPVTEVMVSVVQNVNGVIGVAQEAMFYGAFMATPDVVQRVVEANDPRFTAITAFGVGGLMKNLADWQGFTDPVGATRRTSFWTPGEGPGSRTDYKSDQDRNAMGRRVKMIRNSRDAFSLGRDWTFFSGWLPISPFQIVQLRREGATDLVGNQERDPVRFEWKARDSLSLHIKGWRWSWRGPKTYKIETPIGWAQTIANDGLTRDASGRKKSIEPGLNFWLVENRKAERQAINGWRSIAGTASRQSMRPDYSGVRIYRDLTDAQRADQDPRLELRIEVAIDGSHVSNSSSMMPGETVAAPVVAAGDALSSLATAELFYRRPDHKPNERRELANAYNPYWDVRLKATSKTDRALAVAARGITAGNATPVSRPPALVPYGQTGGAESPSKRPGVNPGSGLMSFKSVQARNQAAASNARALHDAGVTVDEILAAFYGQRPVAEAMAALPDLPDPAILRGELDAYIDGIVAGHRNVIEQQLKEELAQALEQAARELLDAVAENAFGMSLGGSQAALDGFVQNLEQQVTDDLGPVQGLIDDLTQAIGAADEYTRRVEIEMNRIRNQVVREFGEAMAAIEAESGLADEIREYNQQIDDIDEQLAGDLSDADRLALEQERAGLVVERDALLESLIAQLAQALVDIVDAATDVFDVPLSVAINYVQSLEEVAELMGELPEQDDGVADLFDGGDQEDENDESDA